MCQDGLQDVWPVFWQLKAIPSPFLASITLKTSQISLQQVELLLAQLQKLGPLKISVETKQLTGAPFTALCCKEVASGLLSSKFSKFKVKMHCVGHVLQVSFCTAGQKELVVCCESCTFDSVKN